MILHVMCNVGENKSSVCTLHSGDKSGVCTMSAIHGLWWRMGLLGNLFLVVQE